jgi:hypothetical protein
MRDGRAWWTERYERTATMVVREQLCTANQDQRSKSAHGYAHKLQYVTSLRIVEDSSN